MTIDEINKALESELYILALMGTLVLIDSCAKVEYPNIESNKKRYIQWYDNFIFDKIYGNAPKLVNKIGKETPKLTGEVVYSLRCSLLHEDNPNIQVEDIKNEDNKITKFKIIVEKKNSFDIYTSSSGITWVEDKQGNPIICDRSCELNIQHFCYFVLGFCEDYFITNKTKFKFDYTLFDIDKLNKEIRRNEIN